jgi:hypothetical protein
MGEQLLLAVHKQLIQTGLGTVADQFTPSWQSDAALLQLHLLRCCRALALTIEELRALLALVLGASDLVLLFTLRALADEQLTGDKASLNLQVLRKQVCKSQPRSCLAVLYSPAFLQPEQRSPCSSSGALSSRSRGRYLDPSEDCA